MSRRARRTLFNVLRLSVCVAALWFVVHGVTVNDHVVRTGGDKLVGTVTDRGDHIVVEFADGQEQLVPKADVALDDQGEPRIVYGLKTAWRNSRGILLLLTVLIFFPVVFMQGLRLQLLLRAQTIQIGYWECVKLSFAGNFLNFATPLGSHAGDVFKAYFVTTHTEHKTEAATTIGLDRAIGLGTLILCVGAVTTFSTGNTRLTELRPYVLSIVAIGIVVILAYLSPTLRAKAAQVATFAWHGVPHKLKPEARQPLVGQLRRIDRTARTLAGHKVIVVAAVLVTVALQTLAISAYFTVAVALRMDAHAGNAWEYYAYFFTGSVIQALPGPPQGLGTVELAYRYFFAPFGSASQIVCVAIMIRLVTLVCSLPGLLVTLTGSYRPRDASPAVRQTCLPPLQSSGCDKS